MRGEQKKERKEIARLHGEPNWVGYRMPLDKSPPKLLEAESCHPRYCNLPQRPSRSHRTTDKAGVPLADFMPTAGPSIHVKSAVEGVFER